MARAQRRAQAVARLRHPNLVRLLPLPGGAGLSPVLGDARRLADFTLPAGTFKRFDLEQVVRLLLDVLSGLSALHEVVTDGQTFVHGHVSPQHIYIDEHGTARLIPLLNGAKLEDAGYTAPERLARSAVDSRADVFSVGVMLWEALAGKRLFPQGLERATELKPPAIQLSPDARWALPLCALAERAIAREPSARFGSALELSNALATAAAQRLSRVDRDTWQEEAPTPVFQPRLHLATLRALTPPPSVLSLAPVADEAVAAPSAECTVEPTRGWGRRGRIALVGVALSLGVVGVLLSKSPSSWRRAGASVLAIARAPLLAAGARAPASILRHVPATAPVSASASAPASASASALAVASASAPIASVAPAPSPPLPAAKGLPSASPTTPRQAKPKGVPRTSSTDYGI